MQKLEEEKTAVFKKRGNEIQYRFNKLLDNRFENALDELQKSPYLKKNLPVDHERKLMQQ